MSRPDTSQLSSNWKILQTRLKAEKKDCSTESNGLKRKRLLEKSTKSTTNGFKKARVSKGEAKITDKRRKMGSYLSTTPIKQVDKTANLINNHDIDPSDITAAYGSSTNLSRSNTSYTDEINGRIHPSHKVGKYVSLDCEMVGTGPPPHDDNVLARASLVNFHGEQIYDSYVQAPPSVKVHDYRTHVSGIQPHHMKPGYARPFAEVQSDVAKLLEGRILVGHALRNDLNTLMLSHPKRDLRDTSRHPKFRIESKGRPPALRKLAKSELGLEIQSGEHSSIEDARAAMMLFKKEKVGFEEENRKTFGQKRLPNGKRGKKEREVTPSVEEDSDVDEDEDEEDLDALTGEEEELAAETLPAGERGATQSKGKKRKKKKRTKRK